MISFLGSLLVLAVLDLGELFADKSAWEETSVNFAVEHQSDGFTFASQERDIVNCLNPDTCTWKGLKVFEARIYYGDATEGARRVELSLYNRGDDRSGRKIGSVELKLRLEGIAAKVDPKAKFGKETRKKLPSGGYHYSICWSHVDPVTELTWGVSGAKAKEQTADFIRLTFYPKGEKSGTRAAAKARDKAKTKPLGAAKLKESVVKDANGDVRIDGVPMVDQGQKGYCAAAVSERVLRHFGHSIDEHEIAQMAGTTAGSGTSQSKMIEAVKHVGSKCYLGYSEIVMLINGFEDIEKDLEQYNKAAKAAKAPQLRMEQFMHGNMFDVGAFTKAKVPKVMREVRVKDGRYQRFLAGVKQNVDQGIPVIWGVTLGIFPEMGVPQTGGGHMRLIIGYNQKKHEILYSDSWGAGHELKRMPEDWAFTITDSAFCLRPLR